MVAVAFVACAAVGVASLLPSELVADEMNERIDEVQPTPYARVPSSAQPVDERITFGELEGLAEQYPPTGNFYFVTVTEPAQTILSWVVGRDEPAVEFLTEEEKFGFQTPQQRRVFGLESMRTSEQIAQYVALKAVGYDVTIVPGDVLISEMVCLVANDEGTECLESSPSDEVLDPGDRLLEVDGVPLSNVDDLSAALADKEPGDTVEIKLERPDVGELTVTVELTSASDEPDRTIVGFLPFDTRRVELPFELDIDTGRIGGPSAGLAFTLTLIDELTPGELTGGQNIAITGTIGLDGTRRGDRRSPPEGVGGRPGRGRRVPRACGTRRGRHRESAASRGRWIAHHPGRHRRRGSCGPRGAGWRADRRRSDCHQRTALSAYAGPMAVSISRPDPTSPASVAEAKFSTARRGYDQDEVRELLRSVAAELRRSQEREVELERELRIAQSRSVDSTEGLDDETVARVLGEETLHVLQTARESASQIKIRAEEGAARILREATEDANRTREQAEIDASRKRTDAAADAEGEVSLAKQQGREMVNEARAYRERVLSELTRRRELARQQIEQLILGRDRLLQVFERARLVAVDVVAELTPLGEPDEYVDLSPTTGPVPMMVPARSLTGPAGRATAETDDEGAADAPAHRDRHRDRRRERARRRG